MFVGPPDSDPLPLQIWVPRFGPASPKSAIFGQPKELSLGCFRVQGAITYSLVRGCGKKRLRTQGCFSHISLGTKILGFCVLLRAEVHGAGSRGLEDSWGFK